RSLLRTRLGTHVHSRRKLMELRWIAAAIRCGHRTQRTYIGLTLVALLALGSLTVNAQERFGSIAGKVADTSGGVLPGVTVTVTNNATKRSSAVATGAEGTFLVPTLEPGRYS